MLQYYNFYQLCLFALFLDIHFIIQPTPMGCGQSTQSIPFDKPSLSDSKSPVFNNLSNEQRAKIIGLIENDEVLKLTVLMDEIKALPQSAISEENWMTIHLCCRWDADDCLQFLLKEYFIKNNEKYVDFVNAPTKQGYTPLHICGIYKSEKCFQVLHGYGGLNLNAKDKSMKTPLETALSYNCKKMQGILADYKKTNLNFTQIEAKRFITETQFTAAEETVQQFRRNRVINGRQIFQNNRNNDNRDREISQMEREMMQQRRRLQGEKDELARQKLQAQKQILLMKVKLLQEQNKKQNQLINKMKNQQMRMKEDNDNIANKKNQALSRQLQLKEKQLRRVKNQLSIKQEERLKTEKEKQFIFERFFNSSGIQHHCKPCLAQTKRFFQGQFSSI